MIKCTECKGENIEQRVWINANTQEILDACSDSDLEDNWCRDCDDHVEIYDDLVE